MQGIKKFLICVSSDANNPERQWCKDRKKVMVKLAAHNGIEGIAFDYDSEFYRLETRKGTLSKFCKTLINVVRSHKCDAIFTHNPHGEYGHLDHKLVFNTIFDHVPPDIRLLYTDICQESNWPSDPVISDLSTMLFYQDKVMDCVADEAALKEAEMAYRAAGCWTWDKPIVKRCGVYRI